MKNKKAQSLMELLIAVAVFVLVSSSIGFLIIDAYVSDRSGKETTQASFFAQEGIEAVKSIRDNNWEDLTSGEHGLDMIGNKWVFQGEEDDLSAYLNQGRRKIIVEEDDTCKSNCKKVTSRVDWQLTENRSQNVSLVTYFTNLASLNWYQTLLAEFDAGKKNSVRSTQGDDGEVELALMNQWSDASVLTSYNTNSNGDISDIYINNNLVYVSTLNNSGEGNEEFFVLDISDITNGNIAELGSVEIGNNVRAVFVDGNYAYLATDENNQELMIIRLSDYTKVNQYNLPSNANALDVFVTNNVAYIVTETNSSEEFYALDVSNPEGEISELGKVEIGTSVNSLTVFGNYAYLATNGDSKELSIIRLIDYNEINTFNLDGSADATSIVYQNGIIYLGRDGSSREEFYALDVSNPEGEISELGKVDLGAYDINNFYVDGQNAYLATNDNSGEVKIINLNTYTKTSDINLSGGNNILAIWFQGAHIFIGVDDDAAEFQVLLSGQGGWTNPEQISFYNIPGSEDANDLFVLENYVYLVTNEDSGRDPEFFIFNIADPKNPVLRSSLNLETDINSIFVSGNYAYLATNNNNKELIVINVFNKDNPFEVSSFNADSDSDANDVFVSGNYAYLVTQENTSHGKNPEFYIIDVSNPELLPSSEVSYLEPNINVSSVFVSGNYAYLATDHNSQELMIVDVSDPSNPSFIGSYDADSNTDANDVFVSGSYAYLVTQDNTSNGINPEFYILNVANPAIPVLIGYLELNTNINQVFVLDNYAYLGTDENNSEFQMVDISNPEAPAVYSVLDLNADARGIKFNGSNIFLATEHDSAEFQVLGPSTAESFYARFGIFTSENYDVGTEGLNWNTISWTEGGEGNLKIQLRTAADENGLTSAKWIGSDGTENSYYTIPEQKIVLDPQTTGKRWIQYRVFLTTDNESVSPVLQDITLNYNNE